MVVFNVFVLVLTVVESLAEDLLKSQFPLYGLSQTAANKSSEFNLCNLQLKSIHTAIRQHEAWALRMLDSSGSPVNGFIWGNNYWLGTYSQCQWISTKKPMLFPSASQESVEVPPFPVRFYVSLFKQNTSLQAEFDTVGKGEIHLGLCLPWVCTHEDLEPLLTLWANESPLAVQSLYNFTMVFQKVRAVQPNLSWVYNPITIILSLLLMIVILLTLSGTIYDIYIWSPSMKRDELERKSRLNNISDVVKSRNIQESGDLLTQDNNLNNCLELKIDNSQRKSIPFHVNNRQEMSKMVKTKQGLLAKLSLCFSAIANMKIIFETPIQKDEFSVIHGLRFLGMIWLIWLYSVFYLKYYAENKPLAQRISEGFSEHIISNSTFSVDIFFFTSGFTLAFKYYKNLRGSFKPERNFSIKRKVNEFSQLALRRFVRMTPAYAVTLAIVIITVRTIRQTSLFEVKELADEICEKYWWRNIAYINNLFKGDEMCMSWSWYLSTDMQFFLLGVLILILSTRFWKLTFVVAGTLIALSSLTTGYLSYGSGYISSLHPQLALLHVIHFSPWTRIGPYLIGMFTGYFVAQSKGELIIKKSLLITCWVIWCLCNIWALFGLYTKNMSVVTTAIHTALSRTAWGFGLSWIVVACCTKNAGAIKAVLSYPGWIPFSKLSYSAYLISPLIINLIVSNSETAVHLDFIQLVVYFFGHLGIIYICAFFFSMVFEMPLRTLGNRLIGDSHAQNQLNRQS